MNTSPKIPLCLLPALGLSMLLATSPGEAAENRYTPCKATANRMFNACRLDSRDDQMVALANCQNVSDKADRRDCRKAAYLAKDEEFESCAEQYQARLETCELLGEYRYDQDPLLDPTIDFVDPNDEIGTRNPYVSMEAGHTMVLQEGDEIDVVHVTDETREIQGVPCRVVVDIAVEEDDGEYGPVEVTDDWLAQDSGGNVYYCGELSRNYEDGVLADLDGSFTAGVDSAKAGALLVANPTVDTAHRQEFSLGEAEDVVQYLELNAIPTQENSQFPCADAKGAGRCLKTLEFTPLEPGIVEYKYYLPDVGFIVGETLEDGLPTERAELVCVGDSLEILDDEETCRINNPQALRKLLCELSPTTMCDDGADAG